MLSGVLSLYTRSYRSVGRGFGLKETNIASATANLQTLSTILATDSASVNGQRGYTVRRVHVAVRNAHWLIKRCETGCTGDPGAHMRWSVLRTDSPHNQFKHRASLHLRKACGRQEVLEQPADLSNSSRCQAGARGLLAL